MCSLIVFNHELGLGAQELYIIKQDQGRQETSIHLETIKKDDNQTILRELVCVDSRIHAQGKNPKQNSRKKNSVKSPNFWESEGKLSA